MKKLTVEIEAPGHVEPDEIADARLDLGFPQDIVVVLKSRLQHMDIFELNFRALERETGGMHRG